MVQLSVAIFLLLCAAPINSDIYLHNPRGSNNRLNGNGRDRKNANRLFDSQNNDRGGYNVGNLYYTAGSVLPIEWTNQHSCGNPNNFCEIIIQYMCNDLIRDGTKTTTIPNNPAQCNNYNCDKDREYGMHENFYYQAHCNLRERNNGLYTADQDLKGKSARYTRQNPAGTRRGYECSEERDYYPYWGPTPWKDVAVLTNDVSRCAYYQSESQNTKTKFACEVPYQYLYKNGVRRNMRTYIPITQEGCENFKVTLPNGTEGTGVWKEYPAHNIPAPKCANALPSRDNHLGNTIGGHPATFNWTVPETPHESCVLRIRYNISTADYEGWNTNSSYNNDDGDESLGPDVWTAMGLTEEQAKERGYVLTDDPRVNVFNTDKFKLALAINTAQFGRTFQDRTHRFEIRARDSAIPADATIYNLNVRGKRGNIVQVYPAVEYDFAPNTLRMSPNEYVHLQWTGSNFNPQNNDGQGTRGTDRSNVVPQREKTFIEGNPALQKGRYGHSGVSFPSNVSVPFLGWSVDTKIKLATLRDGQYGGSMEELNDAGTYYDIGPRKVTMRGDFNYMCTRNNNFSNRSQKGKIVVKDSQVAHDYIGTLGGSLALRATDAIQRVEIKIPPAALSNSVVVQLESYAKDEAPELKEDPPNTDYISNFVHLSRNVVTAQGNNIEMMIELTSGSVGGLTEPIVYRTIDREVWSEIATDQDKSTSSAVIFYTNSGGHFVVSRRVSVGPLIGLILGCIVAIVIIGVIIYYFRTKKMPLASYRSKI